AARGRLRNPAFWYCKLWGCSALAHWPCTPCSSTGRGHYVVAAGWIGHAIWDVAHHRDLNHHRAVGVVPRWYAESCFVLDLLIGASLLVSPTL
ncbi:MAG: hypothetical protein M3332_06115, partial [Actinomycetota bacterium]|nr:hypothetical protein [Actinomycetota bacterium]